MCRSSKARRRAGVAAAGLLVHDPDRRYASAGAAWRRTSTATSAASRSRPGPLRPCTCSSREFEGTVSRGDVGPCAGPSGRVRACTLLSRARLRRCADASATLAAAAGRLATQRAADEAPARGARRSCTSPRRGGGGPRAGTIGPMGRRALARYEEAEAFSTGSASRDLQRIWQSGGLTSTPRRRSCTWPRTRAWWRPSHSWRAGGSSSPPERTSSLLRELPHTGRLIRAMRGAGRGPSPVLDPPRPARVWPRVAGRRRHAVGPARLEAAPGDPRFPRRGDHRRPVAARRGRIRRHAHERRNAYVFEVASKNPPRVLEGHEVPAVLTGSRRTAGGSLPRAGRARRAVRSRTTRDCGRGRETWTPAGQRRPGNSRSR